MEIIPTIRPSRVFKGMRMAGRMGGDHSPQPMSRTAVTRPRVTRDTFDGGEIPKIYAASSGLMAMFYAILDGERLWELPCLPGRSALCVRWTENGERKEGYWFTIDYRAIPYAPWRAGTAAASRTSS